ncbi:ABC transporter substrate-binding protein [Pseudorhodoferax sp.]|jgi:iron complex transport system substrate-binding protein|uniref:ABC transporter substrate-binding protein n=1 Tax=Pseudorhodoferax sp. TaxID=1993553 RepID=UPI002DD68484|nr:helical backbone metal receptor [Pseudorhodoferax sp.]
MKPILFLLLNLWLLGAQALTLRDDAGREHLLKAPAQRIVSLLPSLTESVCALGGCARLVGVDRYSNWPAEVRKLPQLGGLDDAQIETIVALRPDVVLASTSARALDRLEALGLVVLRLKSERHADVQRTLSLLARLLGSPERAAPLWQQLQRQLQAAAARVPERLRGASVYFEIGGGPYAAGTSSFIGETLQQLGLANIVPAELGPFPKLNPEFVVRARPAVLMGPAAEQAALRQRPGWSSIPALQQGRLCGFAAEPYELLIRPGPRLGEAAERLAECLETLP